jgi:hypothetical protein
MSITPTKAPPKFVENEWAWEYTLSKLERKGKLDDGGNPTNYAAACAIYKAVVKKYVNIDGSASDRVEDRLLADLDRPRLLAADGVAWRPIHGVLVASGDDCNYLMRASESWHETRGVDGATVRAQIEPNHRWRMELTFDDGRVEGKSVPTETALWLTRKSEGARELFVQRTEAMLDDLRCELSAVEQAATEGRPIVHVNGLAYERDDFSFANTRTAIQTRIDTFEAAVSLIEA